VERKDDVWVPPVGARVQRIGQTFCGIVVAVEDGRVKVHWGTSTQAEGKPGIPIMTWDVPATLEPFPHNVVSANDIAERVLAETAAEIQKLKQ
jgi:hypothetical protein